MNTPIRHGDVNLHPVEKVEGKEVVHNGSYILAYGETTGHKHLLTCSKMKVLRADNGKFYLSLAEDGTLTHEEHKTLTIPAGDYAIVHEREMDWFSLTTRKVLD